MSIGPGPVVAVVAAVVVLYLVIKFAVRAAMKKRDEP